MTKGTIRLTGPAIRLAMADWIKKNLINVRNIETDTQINIIDRLYNIDDDTYIDVLFDIE
ncbi:hypothetical protein KAU11_06430 [Candidatus Babeliales bacterium]|nr:hypothetical protein [Candidatus Babeliales bacterium]